MSTWRALTDFFVAPAPDGAVLVRSSHAPARPAASSAMTPAIALLCAPRRAEALAAAVALRLACRGSAALALVWTGGASVAGGRGGARPTRAARRLVQDLEGRGVAARATGRAVLAALPAEPALAVAEVGAARTASAEVASVLVLAGPRDEALEHLLARCDVVLVAEGPGVPDALLALAVAGLRERGLPARVCALPSPRAAALSLRTGALPPGARRLLDAALEGIT